MWCQTSLFWIIIIIKYWQFYIIVVVTMVTDHDKIGQILYQH